MLVEELFAEFAARAKNLDWEGARGETILTQVQPDAGTDLARGPWIKFKFRENGKDRSVQGYFLFTGGQRVRLDGNIEVENDHVGLEFNGTKLIATFSGRREVNGKLFPFLYLFSARLA